MTSPVIQDLDQILNDEIIRNQNNDGSMKTSFEIKQLIYTIIKKNWLFISVLILGNIGIFILYRKLLKK
jgi:hypothetical protein